MSSVSSSATMRRLWRVFTPSERREMVVLLVLMFIGMLLETFGVGIIVPAVGLITQSGSTNKFSMFVELQAWLGNPSKETLMIGAMFFLVCVYIVKSLFLAWLYWCQNKFAFRMQVRLSQHLFILYLQQPYAFHLQRNSAKLMHTVAGEVSAFIGNGIVPGMLLINECAVLIGMGIMLVLFEPVGAVTVVCILGLAAWSFHRITRSHISKWGDARQRHEMMRLQHLQQGLGGVKDVKLFGREAEFLARYREHNAASAHISQMQATLQLLPRLWLELLAVSALAILVICMLFQHRDLTDIVPVLGLFGAAAFRLIPSVNRILGSVQLLRFGLPGIRYVMDEIDLPAQINISHTNHSAQFKETLTLSKVSYRYEGATMMALDDVSLTIHRGESIGFIGTSGAGKSTLIDVLLGLLTPITGSILLDGKDIQGNLRAWQDQIGYVSQSIFLTDDSLRRNVAFGVASKDISEVAVAMAIRAAQLEEFVERLPEGLDTVVGERGVRLSGGQRQRIGIARALYHDPDVLVLDEATSALDVATELEVMKAVTALKGVKTVVIIAHRLSTVSHCDRLYKLDSGRIIDHGSPEILTSTH